MVTDFGTNQKCICNFLLVRHNNLGLILPRFRNIAGFLLSNWSIPLFHPNFGCVSIGPHHRCWGQPEPEP